jgi:hypothetical protein
LIEVFFGEPWRSERSPKVHTLVRRIEELYGLHSRLHLSEGKSTLTIDGTCQGVEADHAVLSPSSQGERTAIPLGQIAIVTQLAEEFGEKNGE